MVATAEEATDVGQVEEEVEVVGEAEATHQMTGDAHHKQRQQVLVPEQPVEVHHTGVRKKIVREKISSIGKSDLPCEQTVAVEEDLRIEHRQALVRLKVEAGGLDVANVDQLRTEEEEGSVEEEQVLRQQAKVHLHKHDTPASETRSN